MKMSSLFPLFLILMVSANNSLLLAQKSTTAKQLIVANGGKFEGGPTYTDYVTIESYDLSTLAVTVFNTIYTQSVQDVLISGNHAYVTAQDSVVMYNIDTYQRVAAVKDSGVNKMALNGDKLIVTKQYPVGRFHVEVLDAKNLGLIAFVDGIPGDCEGLAVDGDHVYVAVDSGYQGVEGRLAIINTADWTIDNIINFGSSAIGIYSVYSYNGFIFCVNRTPYGGGNIGSITRYDPSTGNHTTHTLAVNIGQGFGIIGNLLYLGMNSTIGSYNLDTQAIIDTSIISYFGPTSNVELHSASVDYINSKFYTNDGDRSTYGIGLVFSLSGDSLTSYTTGINADACAIDFRTPAGIATTISAEGSFFVYPNPATDIITINLNASSGLKEIQILDLTGRTIETRPVRTGEKSVSINVQDLPSGIYLVSFSTDQGIKVKKFIRR